MNYFKALTVAKEKGRLVGKLMSNGATLDEIVIVPSNTREYQSFIKAYIDTLDAQKSIAPFIESDVIVLGVFDKARIHQENVLIISEI